MKIRLHVNAWRAPGFVPPAGPPRRTAVLRNLRVPRGCRRVDPATQNIFDALESFRPDAIAGSYAQLTALSGLTVNAAVIVFTEAGTQTLSPVQRDTLWDLYRVPIFEQLLTADGRLLATECEAHDGLHIVEDHPAIGALSLTDEPCACGQNSRRIAIASRVLAAAAY